MLHQLLEIIQTGEVHDLQEIARSMNTSADLMLQIIKDLTNKGYLQEINPNCDEQQNACTDCPVNSGCHNFIRQWLLTEKGKAVVSDETKATR